MALNATDWIVVSAYLLLNLLIGLYYRRRSAGSTEEFFVSGTATSYTPAAELEPEASPVVP